MHPKNTTKKEINTNTKTIKKTLVKQHILTKKSNKSITTPQKKQNKKKTETTPSKKLSGAMKTAL